MMTTRSSFVRGFKDADRLIRWGFEPDELTPRIVAAMRPSVNTDSYLNGWEDGRRGDTRRMIGLDRYPLRGIE